MIPHSYRRGDEAAHAALLRDLADDAPSAEQLRRRFDGRGFDAGLVWYAERGTQLVACVEAEPGGRIRQVAIRPGCDAEASVLLQAALAALRDRRRPFAWTAPIGDSSLFLEAGFVPWRDVLTFGQDALELPTLVGQPGQMLEAFQPVDLNAVVRWPDTPLTGRSPKPLLERWSALPGCGVESLRVLRRRGVVEPLALGRFVVADDLPEADATSACDLLGGRFGIEDDVAPARAGILDFVCAPDTELTSAGLDFLGDAAARLDGDHSRIVAQVASDRPALVQFFGRHLRRLGSFPTLRRPLS